MIPVGSATTLIERKTPPILASARQWLPPVVATCRGHGWHLSFPFVARACPGDRSANDSGRPPSRSKRCGRRDTSGSDALRAIVALGSDPRAQLSPGMEPELAVDPR